MGKTYAAFARYQAHWRKEQVMQLLRCIKNYITSHSYLCWEDYGLFGVESWCGQVTSDHCALDSSDILGDGARELDDARLSHIVLMIMVMRIGEVL
jgi:hypothetical protein